MKQYLKFSLLIVLVTLFGCVFAQKHSPKTYDENQQAFRTEMNRLDSLCKSSEPTKKAKASDEKWYEPASIIMFDQEGNPAYKHSWTYVDANNALIKNILTEQWENFDSFTNKYVKTQRRTFTYDKNGNWTHCLIEVWNGKSWTNYYRFECKYDDKNRMTFQTQDQIHEGEWKGAIRWTNTWNDSDSVIDRMFERATIDGVWVKTTHQIWEYDASGNLLQVGISILKASEETGYTWTGYTGWIYSYNEAGLRTSGIATYEGDSSGRETYAYDEQGNRLSRTVEQYLEKTWAMSWRNEYTYENKRMKTQSYDQFIKNAWIHKALQTWDYNENGNILKWTDNIIDSISGEKIDSYQTLYTYDKDNHLLKSNQEIYNSDTKKWITGFIEEFSYDAKGNKLTEAWSSPWADSAFMKIFDVAWAYDENGNCSMIKATAIPEKTAYSIYYNNSLASYGIPHFFIFAVSTNYVDIRNGTAVTSITLNEKNLTLEIGKTFQLEATINPTDATNKEIRWSSSDDKIVSISSEGLAKVLKKGSATITVMAVDGGLTDQCAFTAAVSIDNIEAASIHIFTSQNSIFINSDMAIKNVSVQDISGRLVYTSNNANPIATSSWRKGVYIVKAINANNALKINKILVN